MAKYTVNHSCGHEETHQLYGPGKERQRKIAWLETTPCSECYRAAQTEARAVAAAEAAEANVSNGLPALSGSDKQIAWAETIRAEIMADEEALRVQLCKAPTPEQRELAETALAQIAAEESAGWWIENRGRALIFLVADRARDLAGYAPPVPSRGWGGGSSR